jgi:mannan endo-1,4-beta-mannosidase
VVEPHHRHVGKWASHRRPPRGGAHRGFLASAAVVVGAALVVAAVKFGVSPPRPPHPGPLVRYLGVYEPDSPKSYGQVNQFANVVGREPNLVGYYSGWNEPFQVGFAEQAARHGATVIVQMDPAHISLAKIAAGDYDYYLVPFADQVAVFGHRVVISFGHEMNGYWYTWGYHQTNPAVFVAAWKHIVTLFRQNGATNVTWLWQVNSLSSKTGPPRDWWPGSQYVDWVGVSGYYFTPGETFTYIFDPVVAEVRRLTNDPILIAETGVKQLPGQWQVIGINNLFAGIRAQHDIGLVWFDQDIPGTTYSGGNWRLEGNGAAASAFRTGVHALDGQS